MVIPNCIPAGLAALTVAKVSLKGADLFLGEHPKKLPVHIGGQHKGGLVRNKRLQIKIGLPGGGLPQKADILTVISPLLPIAGKAVIKSCQRGSKSIPFPKGSQRLRERRRPVVMVVPGRAGQAGTAADHDGIRLVDALCKLSNCCLIAATHTLPSPFSMAARASRSTFPMSATMVMPLSSSCLGRKSYVSLIPI